MAKITQIKPQKNKKRFNIYFNGKFSFGLSAESLIKSGLKLGQKLSEKQIRELVFENEFQKLYDKALRFLSFRPRSEKEVRDYLKKKVLNFPESSSEVEDQLINEIVKALIKKELIDDLAFAEWWCQQRVEFRPRGKRMLMTELWQKGVEKKIAQKVVEEMVDEKKLARKILSKKFKTYPREKLIHYLLRRGFSWENIKEVVDSFSEKR